MATKVKNLTLNDVVLTENDATNVVGGDNIEVSSEKGTSTISVSLDRAAKKEGKDVADATLGDIVRWLGGTVEKPIVHHNFTVNDGDEEYTVLSEAIAAAYAAGDGAVIRAWDDFTVDSGSYAEKLSKSIIIEGMKDDREVNMTTPGYGIAKMAFGVRSVTLRNLTVDAKNPQLTVLFGGDLIDNCAWHGPINFHNLVSSGMAAPTISGSVIDGHLTDGLLVGANPGITIEVPQALGGDTAMTIEGSVIKGGQKALVNCQYHVPMVLVDSTFDGTGFTRTETKGLIQFTNTSKPTRVEVKGCTFTGLRREIEGVIYNGPAFCDRSGTGGDESELIVNNCTFDSTVAYIIGTGDKPSGTDEGHYTFTVSGTDNTWTDWDDEKKAGTKMTPKGDGTYSGVGYVGDGNPFGNPPTGTEYSWPEGSAIGRK